MTAKRRYQFVALAAVLLMAGGVGCERDESTLEPAPYPTNAEVFIDEFGPGVDYQAFGASKVDALDITTSTTYRGTKAMKFVIPNEGDPAGSYAGGAFVSGGGRDLSGFDALTFWAKATMPATLNQVGFGNDNTGTSRFVALKEGLPVSTIWSKYVLPIPHPGKLTQERGLFFLAEGPENGSGYELFIDDVQFERLGTLAHPKPFMAARSVSGEIGDTFAVEGTGVTYDDSGMENTILASPGYFNFVSSDEAVATVDANGTITAVGLGTATISATMGELDVNGSVEVTVGKAGPGPAVAAPVPTIPAADVISLFSNAYTNISVDTWSADWDDASVSDVVIAGDDVKKYSNLVFAGIEFTSQLIDASDMTTFHMDIWTPDPTAPPAVLKVKLIDFGADGAFGGGDDVESELSFNSASTPALASSRWVGLDIPLSAFTELTTKGHLAQMIISGDPNTIYVDNMYFYRAEASTAPTVPAPVPTLPAADVVSLFSDVYDDVTVDTWSANWDVADVADITIAGDNVKKYTGVVFAGIEFTSQPVDASDMTHFHIDIWTPDPTAAPAVLKLKLVDFGANGAFGGGDDVEHEIFLNGSSNPALKTGSWNTLDIPFSSFPSLTTRGHLAQFIISGDPNTIYVDNVYFHK